MQFNKSSRKSIKILKRNIKSKKFLLILTGEMRNYSYTFKSILRYFNDYNPTILISSWNNNVDLNDVISKFNPLLIDFEDYQYDYINELAKEKLLDKLCQDQDPYHKFASASMFYKFERSNKLLKILENEYDLKFEYIIKFRPDIYIINKFKFDQNLDDKIIFENLYSNNKYQLSDRFFYCNSKNYLKITSEILGFMRSKWELSNLKKLYDNRSYEEYPFGERLLFQYIIFNKLKYKHFIPVMAMWRKNTFPNISDYIDIYKVFLRRYIKKKIFKFSD